MTEKDQNDIRKQLLRERQEEARLVRKIVAICILVLLVIFMIAIIYTYFYVKGAVGPMDEKNDELVSIHIPIGSSSSKIGTILEENGLIKNSKFFRYYVRYRNESGFQAGDYQLAKSMDLQEIIDTLKEGTVYQEYAVSFTIPEGRWLERVLETIAENTNHELTALQEKVRDRDYLEQLIDRFPFLSEDILDKRIRWPLEGYLFPSRYDFVEENPKIETIIEAMLQRTDEILSKYGNEIENSKYSIHEIMALASIIEGEAKKSEDRYRISGVLYNRLAINMALQVDPTVAYAHGQHFPRTLNEHLDIDSPYNTYRYAGIPVGPINNPGEDSINAALQPEDHQYLYFYAKSDGEVIYTETYGAHQEVLRRYRDN